MDPVADKLIGLTALGLLCWSHRLPVWLLYLLLFREACIFSAIAILTRTGHAYAIRPTRFGKYATFFLPATIVWIVGNDAAVAPVAAAVNYKWKFIRQLGWRGLYRGSGVVSTIGLEVAAGPGLTTGRRPAIMCAGWTTSRAT